jgi:undecaprenyl-diphosphatase
MIDQLVAIDQSFFTFLNGIAYCPVLDAIMPAVTRQENWYPLLGGLWIALLIWGGRRGRMAGIMLIITIALADQLSSAALKPLVRRVRPCNALPLDEIRLLVRRSGAFSFPSSHASNSFGMATVLAWRWPRLAMLFFAVAILVAYSRVYVGVHYPMDVLAGAALGVMCGRAAIWIVVAARRWWERRNVVEPARGL